MIPRKSDYANQRIMTDNPACCAPETSLREVARSMAERDCGALPVLDADKIAGIVTDRDIATRVVVEGRDPAETSARDVMPETPVTVMPTGTVEGATEKMASNQVRRLVVLDGGEVCAGIVSQADLARHLPAQDVSNTLRRISAPTAMASGPLGCLAAQVGAHATC
jgi:CBS domain-containing protein